MSALPGEQQLQTWFKQVDADGSGQVTADELQKALLNGDWTPFNLETVRLMINMFDKDDSGTIGFPEFMALWKYIDDWRRCFLGFDQNRSGTIDKNELQNALRTFGFNLSPGFIQSLIRKYDKHARKMKSGQPNDGEVTFDNFIQICVTIQMLTTAFRRFDDNSDGRIDISYEEFLELVVSNR
ncbi:EF-hand [Basidiobolus meristosporus CBS 931.73]|uniref:EF-hand n=1 Tax=Basidiobolus meristosporus CBS 931.73 TaxID=1314790 RepID=A0A1Y1YZ99_9FUNG|nr:EF-hand [Basidiobolus meristosporus CBS 931.73]|eukprot:ORY03362.1 EF-hand [Basidiobolus meristosporus CBS 931.73]